MTGVSLGIVLAALAAAELERLLPTEHELGSRWEVVREAPEDAARDPDLAGWGVRAVRAQHYTRDVGGSVQVCSVELWAFESEARARAAKEGFAYPDWEIERAGSVLVMLRGLTLRRGEPPRRGVFPDCHRLGRSIRTRVGG